MNESPLLALIFLLGSSLITGLSSCIERIGRLQAATLAKKQKKLIHSLFQIKTRDHLTYALNFSKNIFLVLYTLTALPLAFKFSHENITTRFFVISGLIILAIPVITNTLFKFIGLLRPHAYFLYISQISAIFILPLWPFILFFLRIFKNILPTSQNSGSFFIKNKMLEFLDDSELSPHISPQDKKLILSIISFKDRIARKIMVPRIDMFTLSSNTTIKKAAENFLEQGYSRIPVWKDTVDHVIGALYYKDLLNLYFVSNSNPEILEQPIEKLIKPIVYSPETKKISHLLQEFLNQQIHMAIVVDEYGGTEGIITIEDILEELVGEIIDEYDDKEESQFVVLPSGGWIIDAKMTLIDIEEELGIKIPENPEYDTIGGFIFYKSGAIPSKGWNFHHNDFDLEVLSSSERSLEKIRITSH